MASINDLKARSLLSHDPHSLNDRWRDFWISQGYADGDPETEAKLTWYVSQGAAPGEHNAAEWQYWDSIAP